MSDDRIGRMTSTAELAPEMLARFEHRRIENERERRALVAEGHEKWSWSLDATCPNCGDTGKWPKSIHYCGCDAGTERRRREDEADEAKRCRARWLSSGVPTRFRDYRLKSAPNRQAAAAVRSWLDDELWINGSNLFLFGPVGVGKTGLAVGVMWELHEASCPVRFWSVPDMLDQMRPGATVDDPMEHLKAVSALVLDDLGVEKPSDWVRERLYVLLNARYEAERPTIVTSNCNLGGLADALGERLVSRFQENVTVVAVSGPDRRRSA